MNWLRRPRDLQLDPVNEYLDRLQSFRQTLLKRKAEYEKELAGAERAADTDAANGARELLGNTKENLTMVHRALTVCQQVRDQIEFNKELRPPRGMENGEPLRNLGGDLQHVLESLALYNREVLRTIDQQLSGARTLAHSARTHPTPEKQADLEAENRRLSSELENAARETRGKRA